MNCAMLEDWGLLDIRNVTVREGPYLLRIFTMSDNVSNSQSVLLCM